MADGWLDGVSGVVMSFVLEVVLSPVFCSLRGFW